MYICFNWIYWISTGLVGSNSKYAIPFRKCANLQNKICRSGFSRLQIGKCFSIESSGRPQTCCLAVWPLMLWETHPDSKILGFAKRFGRNRVKADGAVCMLLKSKFGCCCGVPASNLSYCDVNVGGDGRPPFDSLVSLSSHFRIANKHSPRRNIYGSFAKIWS